MRARIVLFFVVVGGLLNYIDRQMIAVLKPMLEAELGWTDIEYGYLVAVFQLAAAVSLVFAGWIVDRVGWRVANPLGVGTWSIAAMAHGLARTLGEFTVVRCALGATEALGTPTAIKTISVWFTTKQRSLAFGICNAATTGGAIVAPLIVPFLALRVGWRMAFAIVGGIGLVWVATWLIMMRLPAFKSPPPATDGTQAADTGAKVPWGIILRDRKTWAIAGAKVMSDQVWWFLLFWMPDLFTRVFGLDMRTFGPPLATVYTMSAIGALLGGFASTRLLARGTSLNRARKLVMLVSALLAVPAPLVLNVDSYWVAAFILGLTLAAHQGFAVNVFATASDVVPPERIGTVIGIGALCGNLAGMVILQFAGWVLQTTGSYAPMFALVSVSYLLALLWLNWLLPEIRPAGARA